MKGALILSQKKSHLPAVVKIINDFFIWKSKKPLSFQGILTQSIKSTWGYLKKIKQLEISFGSK
jgi:hypothetical protein